MGWFNIYAAVYNEEFGSIFDISQKYGRQLLWILAAIVLIVVIFLIDNKIYVYFSYPIYIAVMLLLISVLLFGVEISGSRSWFQIGEFKIQPAEFSKFATILAIANFLSEPGRRLMKLPNFLVVLTLIAIPTILILLQNDTGSALVFTSLVFMLYREGLPGWILLIAFFAIVLFIIALTKPFYWVVGLVIIACWIYAYLKYNAKRDLIYFGIFMLMIIGAAIA
ncbi:MAG TPA: rod shape-determining protein RodA, partial [Salinivirgaceae bacterium]|nr:rod shape-determining protein RodA [Salinivirgaceae bacterium]